MNRTDRLYAIVEQLRLAGASGRTAEQLASRFEVSTRTLKRDIGSLQQAGALIWSQPGPGGGYVLDGAVSLPPVNITAAEAVSLAVDDPGLHDGRTNTPRERQNAGMLRERLLAMRTAAENQYRALETG